MKTLELNLVKLVELDESELKEANGGAGWYPGMNEAALLLVKHFGVQSGNLLMDSPKVLMIPINSNIFHSNFSIKMNTQTINEWGLVELDSELQIDSIGGGFIGDLGYACGYLAGAATNAAKILGDTLWGVVSGELITRGLK